MSRTQMFNSVPLWANPPHASPFHISYSSISASLRLTWEAPQIGDEEMSEMWQTCGEEIQRGEGEGGGGVTGAEADGRQGSGLKSVNEMLRRTHRPGSNSIYRNFSYFATTFRDAKCRDFTSQRKSILKPLGRLPFPWLTPYLIHTDALKPAHLVRLDWILIFTCKKVIYATSLGALSEKAVCVMWHHACNPIKTVAGRGVTFKPSVNIVLLSYSSEADPIYQDQHPRNIISQ